MKVTIKSIEYEFTDSELQTLKTHLHPDKIEYKSVDVTDIAISVGITIIGYAQARVIDAILGQMGKK